MKRLLSKWLSALSWRIAENKVILSCSCGVKLAAQGFHESIDEDEMMKRLVEEFMSNHNIDNGHVVEKTGSLS